MSVFHAAVNWVTSRWPVLVYAVTWTTLLTVTVAVASFTPEVAFVSAISPESSFSKGCAAGPEGSAVRVPIDMPREVVCLPAHLFTRSQMDLVVPPVFAAVVVAGSAFVVRSLGLWEGDEAR